MNSNDVDVYSMLNAPNKVQLLKGVNEDVFSIKVKLKHAMDAGLGEEDFKTARLYAESCDLASYIVNTLYD